jgi:hypothetical protein
MACPCKGRLEARVDMSSGACRHECDADAAEHEQPWLLPLVELLLSSGWPLARCVLGLSLTRLRRAERPSSVMRPLHRQLPACCDRHVLGCTGIVHHSLQLDGAVAGCRNEHACACAAVCMLPCLMAGALLHLSSACSMTGG